MIYFTMTLQQHIKTLCSTLLILGSLLAHSTTFAEGKDALQALSISAMDAEIDEVNGWARYSGEVELEQGSLLIQCDQLQVFRADRSVDRIVATGSPAHYQQEVESDQEGNNIDAHAQRITYQLESRSIELQGDAKIQQGDNVFEGHSIIYQIDNRKIIAKSTISESTPVQERKRVKIVLPVRQSSNSD